LRALRTFSPLEQFDRLEQQLSQQLHSAERVPAAEVHESPEAPAPLLSTFRYGTWTRSFRFPQPIERAQGPQGDQRHRASGGLMG
jgi:HSP20 family protein